MPTQVLFEKRPKMFRAHPFLFLTLLLALTAFGVELLIGVEHFPPARQAIPSNLLPLISEFGEIGFWGVALTLGCWWMSTHFTQLVVTKTHTRKRTGVISNESSQLRHQDVKNIQVDQGPIQYIFGTGTLQLSSAGQAAEEIIMTDIYQPEEIRRRLSRQRGKIAQ